MFHYNPLAGETCQEEKEGQVYCRRDCIIRENVCWSAETSTCG